MADVTIADIDSTWVNSAGVSLDGGELRRADSAAFAGRGVALGVWGGIVRHNDSSLLVSVDGSDVVTVQPGTVVIPGDAVSGTGCYRSALLAVDTGNLQPRHATNGRIDLVVFRQLDFDVVSGHGAGNFMSRIQIITGTPSGTPAVPVQPSMSVELARITVPATGGGAASIDSTRRPYASALGGEIVAASFARLPAAAATGQQGYTLDTGREYRFNGASWAAPVESVPGSASGTTDASGYATITHGLGFTPSRVFVTTNANITATGTNAVIVIGVDTKGGTTFRVRLFTAPGGTLTPSASPYSIDWVAYR